MCILKGEKDDIFVWMMPVLKEDQLDASQHGDPQIIEGMLDREGFFFSSKGHKSL